MCWPTKQLSTGKYFRIPDLGGVCDVYPKRCDDGGEGMCVLSDMETTGEVDWATLVDMAMDSCVTDVLDIEGMGTEKNDIMVWQLS